MNAITAQEKFQKGQTLKPSTYGIERGIFRNRPNFRAEVIGFGRDRPECVRVQLYGVKPYTKTYHMDFLEVDEEPIEEPSAPDPTHITTSDHCVVRHPSQIERERQEAAFYLRVVWPEICGEAATHHSITPSQL